MSKLPSFFTEKFLSDLKNTARNALAPYLKAPNSEDKIILVGRKIVLNELMNEFIRLDTGSSKSQELYDWWGSGFKDSSYESSMYCKDHKDMDEYARKLCSEIYHEYHSKK